MTTEVQSWGANGQAGNKYNLSNCIGDCASRSKNQDPHAKAEAAKETANTFRNVFEQEGSGSGYQASDTCSNKIGTLGGVGDGSMHHKFDQHRDCQGEDVGG